MALPEAPAALAPFLQVAADPSAAAVRAAATGRKILGLQCARLPEELPHALGLQPWRLAVRRTATRHAPSVMQTFSCSWVQALLDQALSGELANLWGVVFAANTCDSLQNLPDIWRRTVNGPGRLHVMHLPALSEGHAPLALLQEELARLARWLERETGQRLDRERLATSARLFNRIRAALRRLLALADRGEARHSWVQGAATGAQLLDAELAAAALETAVDELVARGAPEERAPVRLMLVGGLLDDLRLLEWMEEHDAQPLVEETCTGARTFEVQADIDEADPLADLPRRHLRRSRCAVCAGSGRHRAATLVASVRERRAAGVVFLPYRGCDPHAFDNVLLAQVLHDASIPHLTVEVDPQLSNWGQVTTRLEAFLELCAERT
jgi:benzoyl-CoA reductase/2-hydroxyglutaryl-CoA dehydratase subunit BcrC/BadD/HgdB